MGHPHARSVRSELSQYDARAGNLARMTAQGDSLRWYSVRCIFEMRKGPSWQPRDDRLNEYEERLTLWQASSFAEAIATAETEARQYASDIEVEYLGVAQAFALDDETDRPGHGTEVFSLIRASELDPADYIDRFFDTGTEYQGHGAD